MFCNPLGGNGAKRRGARENCSRYPAALPCSSRKSTIPCMYHPESHGLQLHRELIVGHTANSSTIDPNWQLPGMTVTEEWRSRPLLQLFEAPAPHHTHTANPLFLFFVPCISGTRNWTLGSVVFAVAATAAAISNVRLLEIPWRPCKSYALDSKLEILFLNLTCGSLEGTLWFFHGRLG